MAHGETVRKTLARAFEICDDEGARRREVSAQFRPFQSPCWHLTHDGEPRGEAQSWEPTEI